MLFQQFVKLGLPLRAMAGVLAIQFLSVAFEGVGLGMLLPVIDFLQAGNDPARLGAHWQPALQWLGRFGINVDLALLLAVSFAAILLRQGFTYWRLTYTAGLSLDLIAKTRENGFRLLLAARISEVEGEHLGEVSNDLTIETERAVNCAFNTVTMLGYLLQVLFYTAMLLWLSLPMTLIAASTMGAAVLLLVGQFKKTRQASTEVTRANRDLSTFLLERLRSMRLIRLAHTETAEMDEMRRFNADQRHHLLELRILSARIAVLIEPIVVLIGFCFLYVGVTRFGLDLSTLGLYVLIVFRLLPVVKELMVVRQSVIANGASLMAVTGRMDELTAAAEPSCGTHPVPALLTGLEFRKVGYSYSGAETQAVTDVDVVIPARAITALVGPSGSGKSTLIDMLPRLRDPQSGGVLMDGTSLADINLAALRRSIGYVPQSPQIFNVRLRDHIRYGRSDATDADIWEAARMAAAEDFIRAMPQGIDSLAGEGGSRLSGGQRQRLDLARAIAGRPSILLLDEPTSALDPESEALFRQSLRTLAREKGMTIVMIGHRQAMVTLADYVVVLIGGKVDAAGTHAEVMSKSEWYARTFGRAHENAG